MKAKDVYKTVSSRLQDLSEPRRWPWDAPFGDADPSLQVFLNNALLNVALHRPDSTAKSEIKTLVQGHMQTLGSDDLSLLECVRYMDEDEKPIRAVTRIERSEMDAYLVDWYSENGENDGIWNWAYDRMTNPFIYWVYPGAKEGAKLETVVSKRPIKVEGLNSELEISELFKSALDAWVLFEVMASDTSDANWNKASQYLQTFGQILGVKMEIDMSFPVRVRNSEGAKMLMGASQ